MKHSLTFIALSLIAACSTTSTDEHHLHDDGAPEDGARSELVDRAVSDVTRAQFENIAALAGDWYMPDAEGQPAGETILSYRVSSGGSAVVETVFPGQAHEMVTVYHIDNGDLELTHYCALGNAPSMRAVEEGDGSEVHFECTGVANAASHDDLHMHDAVLFFEQDGRLRNVWTLWSDGATGNAERFELVRG